MSNEPLTQSTENNNTESNNQTSVPSPISSTSNKSTAQSTLPSVSLTSVPTKNVPLKSPKFGNHLMNGAVNLPIKKSPLSTTESTNGLNSNPKLARPIQIGSLSVSSNGIDASIKTSDIKKGTETKQPVKPLYSSVNTFKKPLPPSVQEEKKKVGTSPSLPHSKPPIMFGSFQLPSRTQSAPPNIDELNNSLSGMTIAPTIPEEGEGQGYIKDAQSSYSSHTIQALSPEPVRKLSVSNVQLSPSTENDPTAPNTHDLNDATVAQSRSNNIPYTLSNTGPSHPQSYQNNFYRQNRRERHHGPNYDGKTFGNGFHQSRPFAFAPPVFGTPGFYPPVADSYYGPSNVSYFSGMPQMVSGSFDPYGYQVAHGASGFPLYPPPLSGASTNVISSTSSSTATSANASVDSMMSTSSTSLSHITGPSSVPKGPAMGAPPFSFIPPSVPFRPSTSAAPLPASMSSPILNNIAVPPKPGKNRILIRDPNTKEEIKIESSVTKVSVLKPSVIVIKAPEEGSKAEAKKILEETKPIVDDMDGLISSVKAIDIKREVAEEKVEINETPSLIEIKASDEVQASIPIETESFQVPNIIIDLMDFEEDEKEPGEISESDIASTKNIQTKSGIVVFGDITSIPTSSNFIYTKSTLLAFEEFEYSLPDDYLGSIIKDLEYVCALGSKFISEKKASIPQEPYNGAKNKRTSFANEPPAPYYGPRGVPAASHRGSRQYYEEDSVPGRRSSYTERGGRSGGKSSHRSSVASGSGYSAHEPFEPLPVSENRWVRPNYHGSSETEKVFRVIKGSLNKLTAENFTRVSDKIIASLAPPLQVLIEKIEARIKGKAEETEAEEAFEATHILNGVINIIFDKSVDEPHFSSLYAMICTKIVSAPNLPKIPTQKGQMSWFLDLLLRKCQQEYEKKAAWTKEKMEKLSSSGEKSEDGATKEIAEATQQPPSSSAELTEGQKAAEEEYQRLKLKRRVLGNIAFIGHLYHQGLLRESIIMRCILNLLENLNDEEELECCCKLLTTAGSKLDHEEAEIHMNKYFSRLEQAAKNSKLPNRIRFMILDTIDLRKAGWNKKAATEIGKESMNASNSSLASSDDERRSSTSRLSRSSGYGPGSFSTQDSRSGRRPPVEEYDARGNRIRTEEFYRSSSSGSASNPSGANARSNRGSMYGATDSYRSDNTSSSNAGGRKSQYMDRESYRPPRAILKRGEGDDSSGRNADTARGGRYVHGSNGGRASLFGKKNSPPGSVDSLKPANVLNSSGGTPEAGKFGSSSKNMFNELTMEENIASEMDASGGDVSASESYVSPLDDYKSDEDVDTDDEDFIKPKKPLSKEEAVKVVISLARSVIEETPTKADLQIMAHEIVNMKHLLSVDEFLYQIVIFVIEKTLNDVKAIGSFTILILQLIEDNRVQNVIINASDRILQVYDDWKSDIPKLDIFLGTIYATWLIHSIRSEKQIIELMKNELVSVSGKEMKYPRLLKYLSESAYAQSAKSPIMSILGVMFDEMTQAKSETLVRSMIEMTSLNIYSYVPVSGRLLPHQFFDEWIKIYHLSGVFSPSPDPIHFSTKKNMIELLSSAEAIHSAIFTGWKTELEDIKNQSNIATFSGYLKNEDTFNLIVSSFISDMENGPVKKGELVRYKISQCIKDNWSAIFKLMSEDYKLFQLLLLNRWTLWLSLSDRTFIRKELFLEVIKALHLCCDFSLSLIKLYEEDKTIEKKEALEILHPWLAQISTASTFRS